MKKPDRLYDIADAVSHDQPFDPWKEPFAFAAEVARRACIQHVQAATEAALKAAKIIDDPYSYCGNTGSEYPPDQIIDREAIKNSYPISNIK